MEELMASIMASPEALFIGAAIGFAAAKMTGRRRGGMGMM